VVTGREQPFAAGVVAEVVFGAVCGEREAVLEVAGDFVHQHAEDGDGIGQRMHALTQRAELRGERVDVARADL
jgi:hypothetical protein